MSDVDPGEFRATLSQFCTGVVVATGCLDGVPAGFAAQSFTSLSIDPPLIALCPGKTSTSWPKVRESGNFCINILAGDQQHICDLFARSGIDKFAALDWRPGVTGAPVLSDVVGFVECRLEIEYDAGDHTIAIGRVRDMQICGTDKPPLLFFRGGYGSFREID